MGAEGWALREVGAAGIEPLQSDRSLPLKLRRRQAHQLTLRLFGNPPVDAPDAQDTPLASLSLSEGAGPLPWWWA